MGYAFAQGLRSVARSWGLVVLLFAVNLGIAALLAAPLAAILERDLQKRESAVTMMYSVDGAWWSQWNDAQSGWTKAFSPEIVGVGFAFRNLDLLLRGELPLGLLRAPRSDGDAGEEPAEPGVDRLILGLAALYLLLQTFLLGGVLGVLRSEEGRWTLRGVLHGSGFYFGRLCRVALLALVADYLLFRLNAPFARWADAQAREAVSENAAMAWALGRHALLLLAILGVHLLSSYAKVIVVLEERSSALLAWLSALGFCAANAARTAGHYLLVVASGAALVALWAWLDGGLATTGYRSQLLALALAQGLVLARIALRLSLLGGQLALYRRRTALP